MSEPRIASRMSACWSGWVDCASCGIGQSVSGSTEQIAQDDNDKWTVTHRAMHAQRDAKSAEVQAKIAEHARIVEAGKDVLARFTSSPTFPGWGDIDALVAYCRLLEAEAEAEAK